MNKQSLKQALHNAIRSYDGGECPYKAIESLCYDFGMQTRGRPYKISNGERRLRESESPEVETVYNEKGFIRGYKMKKPNIITESNGQVRFV